MKPFNLRTQVKLLILAGFFLTGCMTSNLKNEPNFSDKEEVILEKKNESLEIKSTKELPTKEENSLATEKEKDNGIIDIDTNKVNNQAVSQQDEKIVKNEVLETNEAASEEHDKTLSYTPNVMIYGKIETKKPYCNGIPPSPEQVESYQKNIPYNGRKIYVRKGAINDINSPIIDSTKTSYAGSFTFQLPAGEYVLLYPLQKDRKIFNSQYQKNHNLRVTDEPCLEKWWENGAEKVVLELKSVNIKIYAATKCDIPTGLPNCVQSLIPNRPSIMGGG